jgi:hypothetical protein
MILSPPSDATTNYFLTIFLTTRPNLFWVWWLKPVILATKEVEIGRISVGGQSRQKVCQTPSQTVAKPVIPAMQGNKLEEGNPGQPGIR